MTELENLGLKIKQHLLNAAHQSEYFLIFGVSLSS